MSGTSQGMNRTGEFAGRVRKPAQLHSPVFACRVLSCLLAMSVALCLPGCSHLDTQGEPRTTSAAQPSLSYIGEWGMKGSDPGDLDQSTSIAADVIGNCYIADPGSQFIDKFDARGTPLLAFQDPLLTHPQSIAVDRGGAIYVTDPKRASVFVFFPNGDRYRELRLPTRANAENMLSVAVDDDGIIYVLDSSTGKVFSYTPQFRLVHTWQPFGTHAGSAGHEGAIAAGSDGSLYIADPEENKILRASGTGHVALEIRPPSDGAAGKLSAEFAVWNKYVFAMDADGRMLHVWTNEGKPVLDLDLAPELGQANRYAPALAVNAHGELLVLDDRESRVLRYKINF